MTNATYLIALPRALAIAPITARVALTKDQAVTALPNWISQSHSGSDIVAPIKARACQAWHVVRRSQPAHTGHGSRLMQRGDERC